ncbi:hypothetical protein XAP6164_3470001 [Xanthomonas phaseoli pv. phaseoli]|uniref:Uncharacterized protein n=1 Tax=Xanthomonas campestris pv. phaseoli TaxID=317013 RepID=A0AB38E6Z2_XANCH|nr:hypothetical protein XAP6984_860006 [Xanthomonas phaseoli pv. phaseoli]SON92685.1 hypothetical protein XAP7430_830006 [Xanthomonas phaseoli pv. phaseoli]SOO29623.1 hypothetical protein XAP6164_3470001 [Xanthomonas phaseoli pv. phaseoli]
MTREGSARSGSQFAFLPLCTAAVLLHHLIREHFDGVQKTGTLSATGTLHVAPRYAAPKGSAPWAKTLITLGDIYEEATRFHSDRTHDRHRDHCNLGRHCTAAVPELCRKVAGHCWSGRAEPGQDAVRNSFERRQGLDADDC